MKWEILEREREKEYAWVELEVFWWMRELIFHLEMESYYRGMKMRE